VLIVWARVFHWSACVWVGGGVRLSLQVLRGMSWSVACSIHLPWVVWAAALGSADSGGARRVASQ
jgi:hypothetical protein